jgi:orotate phosphoribosyltransferase
MNSKDNLKKIIKETVMETLRTYDTQTDTPTKPSGDILESDKTLVETTDDLTITGKPANEIVREIMRDNGYTYKKMAEALGYKTTSGASERLKKENIGVETLLKFLDVLGYELRIVGKKEYKVEGHDSLS